MAGLAGDLADNVARRWYYVDSSSGSDASNGLSPGTAFSTLAKAAAEVAANDTVYLARGGKWREELSAWPKGITVHTHGSGDRPIIDGSDVATNGDFSKTGGRTNVYEIEWTHDFGGTEKVAHRVWVDDTRLSRVSDVAACDAKAGSFYADTPTEAGPDTVYVHPPGSTVPASDSKVYELARRRYCLQLYDHVNHATVRGIQGQRNAHADGAVCVDGHASDCRAVDGRIHNFFIRGLGEDLYASGMEPPDVSGASIPFVTHQSASGVSPNGRDTILRRCTADPYDTDLSPLGGTNAANTIGFYSHTNGVQQLGTVQFEDCDVVSACLTAYGAAQVTRAVYYRCDCTDARYAFSPFPVNELVIIGGATGVIGANPDWIHFPSDFEVPNTIIARGARSYKTGGGKGPISINIVGTTVSITRCTIATDASGGYSWLENGSFTFSNNVMYGVNDLTMLRVGPDSGAGVSFTADNNCYWNDGYGGATFQDYASGLTNYLNIADWRAATGQEANTIVEDALLADPANGDFTIGNPNAIALGAGALADIEDDAVAQALWEQYRLESA